MNFFYFCPVIFCNKILLSVCTSNDLLDRYALLSHCINEIIFANLKFSYCVYCNIIIPIERRNMLDYMRCDYANNYVYVSAQETTALLRR